MLKCRWTRGVERKANPLLRECWTFFIYIFLHQQRKQCLEFALPKLREIWKYLAGAFNSNSHARGLHILLLSAKRSRENHCNEASRLKKNIQKSSALSIQLKWGEVPLQLNSLHLPPKNHNPFVKFGYSKLVRNFKGPSWNFHFDFFINSATKNCKNYSADVQIVHIYYFKPSKKYSSCDTIPLKYKLTDWSEDVSRTFLPGKFIDLRQPKSYRFQAAKYVLSTFKGTVHIKHLRNVMCILKVKTYQGSW
jgi:hypothetical protein